VSSLPSHHQNHKAQQLQKESISFSNSKLLTAEKLSK